MINKVKENRTNSRYSIEAYFLERGNFMEEIKLREEFIKLGQALKATGLVESGVEAKIVITEGEVFVNGEVEYQRGKKLYDGDIVSFRGEEIKIIK